MSAGWIRAVRGVALAVAWAGLSVAHAGPSADATPPPAPVQAVMDWIRASGDNRAAPFAIVDKASAQVFVFGADGALKGSASALLGSAPGDHATPGVGDRELADIPPEERTTPAGRFVAAYGPATGGKTVLWVDYATAISLHPVVNTNKKEQRPKRLASPTADDNRITFGCINVPSAFYRKVVRPTFRETEGVVYVLPEQGALEEAFPAFRPEVTPARAGQEVALKAIALAP